MNDKAFRYYLPALLCLSVAHPGEYSPSAEVSGRLTTSDKDSPERAERIKAIVASLSRPQRSALVRFLDWVEQRDLQAPMLIRAAKNAVADGRVEAYRTDELMRWARALEARLRAKPTESDAARR